MIKTTQQAELEHIIERQEKKWELFKSTNLVQTVRQARDLGWKNKKVQVRKEPTGDSSYVYYVEPYESDCGCLNMLKYADYFE